MQRFTPILLLLILMMAGCKKDSVDSTNLKTFQNSINDMTSSLSTLEQVKFNEALYILKTFGVEADGDTYELTALSKLIANKKVPEILALADQVALKHGIAWTSTGPPSLGDLDVFGTDNATESDPNDISADGLEIIARTIMVDSILGPKGLQIIPRLVDRNDKPISFEGATLETTLLVSNNGRNLISTKNLMQNNNFPGFTVRFPNLNASQLTTNDLDVTVTVKTSKKTYKMSKIGIPVNPKALRQPQAAVQEPKPADSNQVSESETENSQTDVVQNPAGDPKVTVQRFLNNLSSQNLRGAYEVSDNPGWGSYESFSNPNSGFGSVQNLNVNNISTASATASSATVNAAYDVTDKNGKITALKVTFGLKNVNGEWKISNYRIN